MKSSGIKFRNFAEKFNSHRNEKTLLLLILVFTSYNHAQNVNIPDSNFHTYLINNAEINTNQDGQIQITEAIAFTGYMNCSNRNIYNLTGIEAFTSLTGLNCSSNLLTSLDLSQNTGLMEFKCGNNQITSLDISQNYALNKLYCYNNQLSSLDLSQNTELVELDCSSNLLTSLDLSQNTELIELDCSFNLLTSLDLSQNHALNKLYCYNNQLMSLNVANGNNNNIANLSFFASNNPNLSCIQVDDVAYSTANWTNKDATASYNTYCALSTEDFEFYKQVIIFPNPAKEHFQIDLENNLELKTITVYNNLGQQVVTTNSSKVNTASLSRGMYYVEVVTNSGTANKKIIIQ